VNQKVKVEIKGEIQGKEVRGRERKIPYGKRYKPHRIIGKKKKGNAKLTNPPGGGKTNAKIKESEKGKVCRGLYSSPNKTNVNGKKRKSKDRRRGPTWGGEMSMQAN